MSLSTGEQTLHLISHNLGCPEPSTMSLTPTYQYGNIPENRTDIVNVPGFRSSLIIFNHFITKRGTLGSAWTFRVGEELEHHGSDGELVSGAKSHLPFVIYYSNIR